jgi:hypothetical protein
MKIFNSMFQEKVNFRCSFCGNVYQKPKIKIYRRNIYGIDTYTYICKWCAETFRVHLFGYKKVK